jgi:hypothetical protein
MPLSLPHYKHCGIGRCGSSCSTKKRCGSNCSTTKRCKIGRCGPSSSTANRCSSNCSTTKRRKISRCGSSCSKSVVVPVSIGSSDTQWEPVLGPVFRVPYLDQNPNLASRIDISGHHFSAPLFHTVASEIGFRPNTLFSKVGPGPYQ